MRQFQLFYFFDFLRKNKKSYDIEDSFLKTQRNCTKFRWYLYSVHLNKHANFLNQKMYM